MVKSVEHRYDPIGHCIYCGATEFPGGAGRFSDEHIFPYALGGRMVLPEASCDTCAKIINGQIESPFMRNEWGHLRAKQKFPTRKPQKRRTQIRIRNRTGEHLSIPIRDHSTPVPQYRFGGPHLLVGPK